MTKRRAAWLKILGYGVLFFTALLVFDSAVIVGVVMLALWALFHFSSRWARDSQN